MSPPGPDARARLRLLPSPSAAPPKPRRTDLRWRAADAGDRPRPDDQSEAADPRRGHRGPGADGPRGDLATAQGPAPRGPGDPDHRQERRCLDALFRSPPDSGKG